MDSPQERIIMSIESKKSMAWSAVLIVLGILALYTGIRFLAILVPVAVFVYYKTAASTIHHRHSGNRPSSGGMRP
jgi:hypothetical protein